MEYAVIILGVTMDQCLKYAATLYLKGGQSFDVIQRLLSFTYVENTGVAFGMFKNSSFVLIPLSLLIAVLCFYVMLKAKKKGYKLLSFALSLIVSGAIGNLIDRILRGFVVDFIQVHLFDFPVFNFADIFVVTGAILACVLIIFTKAGDIFDSHK